MLDGRGHLLGRLAAIVAKQVLLGKCALPAAPPDSSADQRSVMSNNHHLSFESHDHEINPMHRSETCCLLPPWSWGLWDQKLLFCWANVQARIQLCPLLLCALEVFPFGFSAVTGYVSGQV